MIELQNKVGGQKLYSLFGRFSLFIIISTYFTFVNANSFENFKRTGFETFNSNLDEKDNSFKNFKRTGFEIFNSNLDEKDKLFNSYLDSEWKVYTSEKKFSLYKKAKPNGISPSNYRKARKIGPKVNIFINKSSKKIQKQKNIQSKKEIEFDFFGTYIGFDIPVGIQKSKFYPYNQKGIKNFFNIVSGSEYQLLIDYITRTSIKLDLNDWGKYMLIENISKNIFANQNDAKLFTWFIFNKLGYALRVGLSGKNIIVIYQSDKKIYETSYYKIGEKYFYAIADDRIDKVFTYKQNYPDSQKAFDLSLDKLPNFQKELKTKKLSFNHNSNKYSIDYRYNQNLIDFMSTYPQADPETFFNAPLDIQSYEDIAGGLKKYIDAKHASTALNFVLNFVQKAFKYEVDSKHFGKQKMMFAEETLFYDKSDCEDRAILFSYLVKKLFNINVVGIKYSNHMATALYIPIDGDSIKVHSKKFIIADPTYKNAIIGQSMSKYKRKNVESFIVLKNAKRKNL